MKRDIANNDPLTHKLIQIRMIETLKQVSFKNFNQLLLTLKLLVSEPVSESWIQTGRTRLNRGEHSSDNEQITEFDLGDDAFNGLQ